MDKLFDLNLYLNDLKTIQNELDLNELLNNLQNYFQQIDSIEKSILFQESQEVSKYYDKNELKCKLLFKLNNYVNEYLELILMKL